MTLGGWLLLSIAMQYNALVNMVPQTLIKFDNYLFFVRFDFLLCAVRTTILTITLTSCIWSSSAAAKALHLVIFSLPSSANWITLCNWSWLALLTGIMWISYDRISDSNWCLDSSQNMSGRILRQTPTLGPLSCHFHLCQCIVPVSNYFTRYFTR